ncbi:MAG: formate dehydrogenase subunit alpha [Clostridiales bacterium]|nr:formate dehydrogenase subunit alpha [Clostridiales bacterium]
MINIKIDGIDVKVANDTTILKAAKSVGIEIPTLCYDDRLKATGSCRMCSVEIEGANELKTACTTIVREGMVVYTQSEIVKKTRKGILELLWEPHLNDCLTCEKSGECEFQDLCYEYDINSKGFDKHVVRTEVESSNNFYTFDPNKCILCGKCVRVCEELQGESAIQFVQRGDKTYISHPFSKGMEFSSCVSCGNCVAVCPTGALMSKETEKFRNWEVKKVQTTCGYCGVGCQMELKVKDNKVVEVNPAMGPSNEGLLCVKGKFGYNFINHSDRLKTPLIKKNGTFEEATWDEAYDLIVSKINNIKKNYGANAIAGLTSARGTNEESYLMQKMMRAVIGTNNIDHCARLCHASTVTGLALTMGSGAMTNSIGEIDKSEVIFIIGSNPTENHPVIGSRIRKAVRQHGAKLIVADPRYINIAKDAEAFLQILPGTNIALLNSMMNVIFEEGLYDKEFVENRTEDFDKLIKVISKYTPEVGAEICGIDADDIRKAARLYGKAKVASIFYAMGITQHTSGTYNVAAIANLSMLCGNIGKEAGGVNPLRGQSNVQGACDVGGLPDVYPGYQKVNVPEIKEKFEKAWKVKLDDKEGLTIPKIMDKAMDGELKMLYIFGENPMVSDPDTKHVEKALNSIDFIVSQDIFMTETTQLADVVLPAACFAEKDGTFTNTERRVQRVRKAVDAPGEAKADWIIFKELMNKLGYEASYETASDVFDEIASVTPQYAGMNYERLSNNQGLQWPCPTKDHPGTKFLHEDNFERGLGTFMPSEHIEAAELPDKEYPLIMTTGRILYQYHTRTMTKRVEGLNNEAPENYIEVSPETAKKLFVNDGEKVKVISRRGDIETKIKISENIKNDVVFMPFHYSNGANIITNSKLDPVSDIPEFKVSAVRIEKIN